MSYNSLKIKDGVGDLKSVAAVSSSDGFYPVHVIDPDHTVVVKSNSSERVWVTGNLLIDNFPSVQQVTSSNLNPLTVQNVYASSITETVKSTFNWNTQASGTFQLCQVNNSRKELIIQNSSQNILYIKISSTDQNDLTKNGFTLVNTSSAPSVFNFIIYPSGTYISSEASRVFYHSGYFVSGTINGNIVATSIC